MSAAGKNQLTRIQQYQNQSKLYCVTQNTRKNKKEKSPLQPTYFKSGSFTELPHKFKKKIQIFIQFKLHINIVMLPLKKSTTQFTENENP